ncbi:MAG TPA: ABC transporter permease [Ktedonobacteraceae bacterium]|nr:ABC transporter permease [Ktedonobacteraceae bacterium]
MTTSYTGETRQQTAVSLSSSKSKSTKVKLSQMRQVLIIGGRIVFLALLILLWQVVANKLDNPLFLSSPLSVWERLREWATDGTTWYSSTLASNTGVTLEETLLGLFYGVIGGIVAGVFFGVQPILAEIFNPFIIGLYSIPKVALAPLFILWFGFGLEMKVILAAVTVFFLVFLNTLAGMRSVDQDLINAVFLMGGKRRDVILKVMIPSATGYILTGLRIAIPYALIGAVVAEMVSINTGLGYLINNSAADFDTAGVFSALLVLGVIAGVLNAIVNFIDRKTSRWKAGMRITSRIIPQ